MELYFQFVKGLLFPFLIGLSFHFISFSVLLFSILSPFRSQSTIGFLPIFLKVQSGKITVWSVKVKVVQKPSFLSNWKISKKNETFQPFRLGLLASKFYLIPILFHLQWIQAINPHTVFRRVKSAVSLKWQVGFENCMKIAPIFTIIFTSKMLIRLPSHLWNILF